MLLFPLAPFFVLFCNVIATSNERDFNMIKNITDDLHQFAEANASIGKMYKLFSKFLDLCAPLVKGNPENTESEAATALADGNATSNHPEGQLGPYPDIFDRAANQGIVSSYDADPSVEDSSRPHFVGGWNDSLVWELFDNQPSLGWAESDLWNAMTQFDA